MTCVGAHRTQHTAVLKAVIYYCWRIQARQLRGKARGGGPGGDQVQASKNHLLVESRRMHLASPVTRRDSTCEMLSIGEAH